MSNEANKTKQQHFTALKSQYQALKYEDSSPTSLLYLILRKAELGIEITNFELDWLRNKELLETVEIIQKQQENRVESIQKLELEFAKLRLKYETTDNSELSPSSPLYPILVKLESEHQLTNSEREWLIQNNQHKLANLSREMEHFLALKSEYQAAKHQDYFPDSRLYEILKRLDFEKRLSDSEVNWLEENNLLETLAIFQKQEAEREAEFALLKEKYQATKNSDKSVSSPLYLILKNLDADQQLSESELDFLAKNELSETLDIILEKEKERDFGNLKVKYKATQYEDSSPKSHLYKVLKKIESNVRLPEADINFLKKRELTETITSFLNQYSTYLQSKIESGEQLGETEIDWLNANGFEKIITQVQTNHFAQLKSKYEVDNYRASSPSSPLYALLQKLEKKERLEPTEVAWLNENKMDSDYWQKEGRKLFSGKIYTTYHQIEATFYEQEYKRTQNKWNLPNASSHWRSADEPKRALKLTENLKFDKIKEDKLKSALLTTRGGAFRDINKLDDAEKCALKAIEYHEKSHHPYTLMGAICFERADYLEGEVWFEKAIQRGASPRDEDREIKRVLKNAKDENKRRELVEYLLKKDRVRYNWAESYLKKAKNKKK
jgi:hypothetical protein